MKLPVLPGFIACPKTLESGGTRAPALAGGAVNPGAVVLGVTNPGEVLKPMPTLPPKGAVSPA
jgi:hypothetical protein